jgi:hypothetical protein
MWDLGMLGSVGLGKALAVAVASGLSVGAVQGDGAEAGGSSRPDGDDRDAVRTEFVVERARADVRVDGRMDEAAWTSGQVIPLPYESNPGDNTPARVETRCLVTFDAANLYLGCRAIDPDPARIRAFITDRDDIDSHDRVVFTLDPFNDGRRAFEFGVSALGVQSDAVFNQQGSGDGGGGGGNRDASWDAIWSSAGRVTGDGYVVEAAIPFKSLRFPSDAGVQSWGFFVSRYWPRSEAVETRSMHWDRSNACELCQANVLTGFQDIAPGRNLQFTPAVVAGRTDSRSAPDQALENGSATSELSLDALWGVTSNLTVNVTLNPDFSQVEADAPQLDVNNRFGLFFPEKRSFFQEGGDFFATPIQALFTRTIVSPDFGGKLTGKAGASALGVMLARDELPTLTFPGAEGSSAIALDDKVVTGVARLRRDVGSSNNVGALLVTREGSRYFNRVLGADAVIRPLGAVTARVQVLHSETSYAPPIALENDQPEGAFGGDAGRLEVTYETRSWFARTFVERLSDGFRADAGFVNQVDVQRANLWLRRTFWGDETWFTRINLSGGFWHNETTAGLLLDEGVWLSSTLQGPAQSNVWVNPNLRQEQFEGVTHTFPQVWFGGGVEPSGAVSFEFFGNVGQSVDYANGRLADQLQLNPQVGIRIGPRIDLQLRHSFRRLSFEGRSVVDANVSQLRGVYNFTPRTFFRAIVQHRSTERDPDLYRDDVGRFRRSVLTQFLFSYKLNPQSVLFVGYGDAREGSTDRDFLVSPLVQTDRTFFVKASYAWRP